MLKPDAIGQLAAERSMPAVGVTDTDTLSGALELSEKIAKAGVQPLIGISALVDFEDGGPLARIKLYATSERGYANLMRIATVVAQEGSIKLEAIAATV